MKWSDMKIFTRLMLGFGVLILFSLLQGLYGLNAIIKLDSASDHITKTEFHKERLIAVALDNIRGSMARLFHAGSDPANKVVAKERYDANIKAVNDALSELNGLLVTEKGKKAAAKSKEDLSRYVALGDKVMALAKDDKKDEALALASGDAYKALQDTATSLRELGKAQGAHVGDLSAENNALASRSVWIQVALIVASALFGIVGAWILTNALVSPVVRAEKLAKGVASGDLTVEIGQHGNDEIGKLLAALHAMVESLRRIVGQVRESTDRISLASGEIALGNNDLSSRTEQQAGNLEETASAMEEMTGTVRQNADSAKQANQLAVSASAIASKGGAVVNQVVTTMEEITQSSKKIADIIGVIDGIAFQTNILALNAAVEAARAGEQGRGFAVVASEVRSLAQRSAAAAKEIKSLIGTSVEKVDTGTKLVADAGATMEEIVQSVKRVTDIIGEISASTQEQSAGIVEVNQAVGQLDQMTQQNAALVEESAAAAESLKEQAVSLSELMAVFKLGNDMAHSASPTAAPVRKAAATPKPMAKPQPKAPAPAKPSAALPAKPSAALPAKPAAKAIAPPETKAKPASDDWEEF